MSISCVSGRRILVGAPIHRLSPLYALIHRRSLLARAIMSNKNYDGESSIPRHIQAKLKNKSFIVCLLECTCRVKFICQFILCAFIYCARWRATVLARFSKTSR